MLFQSTELLDQSKPQQLLVASIITCTRLTSRSNHYFHLSSNYEVPCYHAVEDDVLVWFVKVQLHIVPMVPRGVFFNVSRGDVVGEIDVGNGDARVSNINLEINCISICQKLQEFYQSN